MKLQDLRQFEQFSQLSEEHLILIKPLLKVKRCQQAGELILPRGYEKDREFFLIKGRIQLIAADGQQQEIEADTPAARLSIARLRPSLYEVVSASACELLVIPGRSLRQQVEAATIDQESNPNFSEAASRYYRRIKTALENGNFTLPSLPSVALKVREELQREEPEVKKLEKLLSRDPSILAKLLAAANSPLYRRGSPCKTSSEAIMRLGLDTTSELVMLFSLRHLFKAENAWVKQRMQETWSQGVRVGAIAQMLTLHHPQLSADQALVAGLLHNIGELAILRFIDQDETPDPEELEGVLEELMPEAGVLLLKYWNFDPQIIELVAHLNSWQRVTAGEEASLEDLIRISRLHSFIGTENQYRYPRLDEVPAFQKLADKGLTPDFSLTLIEDAKDQVEEIQEMFGL
ncbi:HD-like signal output (HDOD) domain, no enzymatic activity [Marinospirillum celere]|uniref:HD-like signal output (HDOD) domain, no enzymatic activity n=1 Tax=Marinospirillum celere TaxID=1122252 RepID=A0A1I1K4D3_9GAMM|nr:HDOD domain-containing protein [Marinospirillum celere]SFC52430.1 HD-like signal output (HDOD) domain, no enzymatic activity [Marinospirillum celere]